MKGERDQQINNKNKGQPKRAFFGRLASVQLLVRLGMKKDPDMTVAEFVDIINPPPKREKDD